jgi:hypothetical protein
MRLRLHTVVRGPDFSGTYTSLPCVGVSIWIDQEFNALRFSGPEEPDELFPGAKNQKLSRRKINYPVDKPAECLRTRDEEVPPLIRIGVKTELEDNCVFWKPSLSNELQHPDHSTWKVLKSIVRDVLTVKHYVTLKLPQPNPDRNRFLHPLKAGRAQAFVKSMLNRGNQLLQTLLHGAEPLEDDFLMALPEFLGLFGTCETSEVALQYLADRSTYYESDDEFQEGD